MLINLRMLINLPDEGKDRLLHLINRSWTEGRVPSSWKLACIIPILKKDKPVVETKSFRPVSLLPSISKAMESLVQIRLKKWTEDHNIIPAKQAGFQPFRSTSDVLASICQDAMDGLQRKKRTLLVAIDFKAAFDRVWRGGLLRDLAEHGLSGRCLRWLADRRALVKWNNRTSRVKVFSQGTPQGTPQVSPLSPLLYCIATADLPRRIKAAAPTAAPRQFADDLMIGAADTPGEAATDTQMALNVITEWAAEHHVMISVDQTEVVVVSLDPRETAGKAQPPITLLERNIDYKEVTILGVQIDAQLRFGNHAQKACKKLRKRNQILQALAGRDWGMSATDLESFYRDYIRPGGLYAAEVWGAFTADSHIAHLEFYNNMAARAITGAPKASPAAQTRAEIALTTIRQEIEDSAAKLLIRCSQFPEDRHLRALSQPGPRQRLKSRGEDNTHQDWRSTARRRIATIEEGRDPREALKMYRDDPRLEDYLHQVPAHHFHRRATGGQPMPTECRRREEEVILHKLRLNRAPFLQATKHRHGQVDDPSCPYCNNGEEDTEPVLLQCSIWDKERKDTLVENPKLDVLQTNTTAVLEHLGRIGVYRPSAL